LSGSEGRPVPGGDASHPAADAASFFDLTRIPPPIPAAGHGQGPAAPSDSLSLPDPAQAADPGPLAPDPGPLAEDPGPLAEDPGPLAEDPGPLLPSTPSTSHAPL
jgi:hypothetical protein